ncbi:MAG: hypothetical protein DME69_01175 [Verrucomicrobia bacterium]|nr:MAG: hypothetical protein DME87_00850 [Verrucomicrobiota bacterium]PYJ80371.1 MAG: hypothetical protein DME69_01175 [Verrucomicrobiota bacterium]
MKRLMSFLVIGLAVFALGTNALRANQDGLFFDSSQLSHELDEIAKNQSKSVVRFELKMFRDEQLKTPVAPNSDVTVSVVPLVPAGAHKDADLEQINPAKVKDAKKGCTAEYDKTSGKLFVTLRRPYVFQDMRDATSSRTWAYRIDVRLATVGRTIGVGGGVQSDSGRECASFFGILSQKEGKTWKPRRNDHYKYEPEVEPKDWQALGTFKVDTIYQNEAKATFQWKPGSEGKAVSVRWHISGDDKETFEDVWTDWLTQSNPCPPSTGSSSGGPQETATPVAATPVATPLSDETTNRPSRVSTPEASSTPAPGMLTQRQALSNETTNRQSPVPKREASLAPAPGMLTQKQALLNRAKRSNDAVTAFYNSLISRLPIAAQEQLKKQQDKWLEMRRTEAGSEELLAQGLNADPNVLRRFAEMNEARAIVLKTTLRGK